MARCTYPYQVERKLYFSQSSRTVPVPCGKCPECLKRRTASWSFRLEIEALNWPKQHFITLTYDNEHCPISNNRFMTLVPKHLTDFFKRLRKRAGKCKYYACGEYGTKGKRPHYHLILFCNDGMLGEDIIKSWPYGDVYFGKVESASIKYTVQYYNKGDWSRSHARDDREPEFSRMSQGIGKSFLTPAMVRHLLESPDKGYVYNNDGHKIALPRYYKSRLFDYVGTESMIANHPSLLLHRDEMLGAKELHHKAISKVMESIEIPEETIELNEARKAAINNFRKKHRKTRN